eukprot:m.152628 g.152628  ORF g.152628 m.152628 type:complete len:87 (+) comp38596_c0_seq16:1341-1601(+)
MGQENHQKKALLYLSCQTLFPCSEIPNSIWHSNKKCDFTTDYCMGISPSSSSGLSSSNVRSSSISSSPISGRSSSLCCCLAATNRA